MSRRAREPQTRGDGPQRASVPPVRGAVDRGLDSHEREAGRIAEQVTSRDSGALRPPTQVQPLSPPASNEGVELAGSRGVPLDRPVQHDMERRFGHDFSRVRVHDDSAAARHARDADARAFTTGQNIVFGAGHYAPETPTGRHLLAHELTHVLQQRAGGHAGKAVQRVPAPPMNGSDKVPFDRSVVDVMQIADARTDTTLQELATIAKVGFVTFQDPTITSFDAMLFDPADQQVGATANAAVTTGTLQAFNVLPKGIGAAGLKAGRYTVRCVGLNAATLAVAYADRTFYLWTTAPTGSPPDIAALETQKAALEQTTRTGSGKSFGEVGSAFTQLKDVDHDLAILKTGTGTHVGNHCAVKPTGATPSDCTEIVMEVLGDTFKQQGRSGEWTKVKKKLATNTTLRKGTGMSGLDLQAALQSELGWKAVYWAPDPNYQVPAAELSGARSDEAGYTAGIAKSKNTYLKGFQGHKKYPGLAISQSVTNYAPEAPKAGTASTTVKDTKQLDKLKKLPFGVLSAHGGFHMTLITYGKVIEVHWSMEATNANLIEQTNLENWAVGSNSGYHYYASGAIVAPAADIDKAFA